MAEKKNPYKDDYEERYNAYLEKKRKERQKAQITATPTTPSQVQNKIPTELAKVEKEVVEFIKEPKHIRVIKVLALLIPLLIIFYILYTNFIISQDFNYFYDIGSPQDAKKPYLTPVARLTEIQNESNLTYRNATSGLVYFTANIPPGSETVLVKVRFKDNFMKNGKMNIGASDNSTAWHYKNNPVFTGNTTQTWNTRETIFSIEKDHLSIKNSQLSIALDIPHLYKELNQNYTIPIDWINITVHKPGLIEQLNGEN